MSYCFAFFNLFPSVYFWLFVFSCKVFSLYRESSSWQYNQPSRKYSGFFHVDRRRSEYMYSHLTDGSQELYPGVLPASHTVVHSDKVCLLSDPTSDSRSPEVLLSVTLGCGSALAVYPAESIMKHLHALLNPVAPHRCVTGIHPPSDDFPSPSQLLLTLFTSRHLSK